MYESGHSVSGFGLIAMSLFGPLTLTSIQNVANKEMTSPKLIHVSPQPKAMYIAPKPKANKPKTLSQKLSDEWQTGKSTFIIM